MFPLFGHPYISTFTEPELTWVIWLNNKHIKQDLQEKETEAEAMG